MILAAHLEDGVELGIVDFQQLSVLVPDPQTERLVEFQPLRARLETLLQSVGFPLAPVLVVQSVEIDQREGEEPSGMGFVQGGRAFP